MPACAGITDWGYQAGIHENTGFRIEPVLDLIGYSGTTVILFQKIFRGEEIYKAGFLMKALRESRQDDGAKAGSTPCCFKLLRTCKASFFD
jgi:hypothetical protein